MRILSYMARTHYTKLDCKKAGIKLLLPTQTLFIPFAFDLLHKIRIDKKNQFTIVTDEKSYTVFGLYLQSQKCKQLEKIGL